MDNQRNREPLVGTRDALLEGEPNLPTDQPSASLHQLPETSEIAGNLQEEKKHNNNEEEDPMLYFIRTGIKISDGGKNESSTTK